MIRRSLGWLTKTPLIVLLLVSLLVGTGFPAVDFLSSGRIVSGTPFDTKLRNAGCLILPLSSYESAGSGEESVEGLFSKARGFRYASDGSGDRWQTAEETEARHAGDCEDKAIWLFTRLIGNGYSDVRLVIGRYRSIDSQLHVWVIASDKNGNTCLLDPSIQKRIWIVGATDSGFYQALYAYDGQNRYRYFNAR